MAWHARWLGSSSAGAVASEFRQHSPLIAGKLRGMTNVLGGIIDRFRAASLEFENRLRMVRAEQWVLATPCAEWNVRQLVNHVTRGNRNYIELLAGGTGAEFLRMRDIDALGAEPMLAYETSVRDCADAFARLGALRGVVDYPLGRISGRQALAVRTADTAIHAWDLARALGSDDRLDPGLVMWLSDRLEAIYAGLPETPVAVETTHRFFAAPPGTATSDMSLQDRLLHRMGRDPAMEHVKGRVR